MNLSSLKSDLESKLQKRSVSSGALLNSFRMIDEGSRKSPAYQDPIYYPFYFYLGQFLKPKTLLEIGFNLGLTSCCFFKSCNTVENFLAFQHKTEEFYSLRIPKSNLKDVYSQKSDFYIGNFNDIDFYKKIESSSWDLIFVNDIYDHDKMKYVLDMLWNNLSEDGYIVVDRFGDDVIKSSIENFSKVKNREHIVLKTRYLTGVIQK